MSMICSNYSRVYDSHRRTVLHIIASCDSLEELLDWLLENRNIEVSSKDKESGWSALHRSLYYGQIRNAAKLITCDASLTCIDHDGFTPLELAHLDRPLEHPFQEDLEVYTWGTNINYNLGHGDQRQKPTPELVNAFRKQRVTIKQVVMCKFHTIFLSTSGRVYTCGHGRDGRLGQLQATAATHYTSMVPQLVDGLSGVNVIEVAGGQDHTVMLSADGLVYTCGSNMYHQLGHTATATTVLTPKLVGPLARAEQSHIYTAGRYHTVMYTDTTVYACGLNAGQLGVDSVSAHSDISEVSVLRKHLCHSHHRRNYRPADGDPSGGSIRVVTCSDGATVCVTKHGAIYLIHHYTCRRITARLEDISKVCCYGGCLDTRSHHTTTPATHHITDSDHHSELIILVLIRTGQLYMWRQLQSTASPGGGGGGGHLSRVVYTGAPHQMTLTDVALHHPAGGPGMLCVDHTGALYVGHFKSTTAPTTTTPTHSDESSSSPVGGFLTFLNRDECHVCSVHRMSGSPQIYSAVSVACDTTAHNMAVICNNYRYGVASSDYYPYNMYESLSSLLPVANGDKDAVSDVDIMVNTSTYHAHRYILANASKYFAQKLTDDDDDSQCTKDDKRKIIIEKVSSWCFEQILQYIYTDKCEVLEQLIIHRHITDSSCKNKQKHSKRGKKNRHLHSNTHNNNNKNNSNKEHSCDNKKSDVGVDVVSEVFAAGQMFGISALTSLGSYESVVGKISRASTSNPMRYSRSAYPHLCDMRIQSTGEGKGTDTGLPTDTCRSTFSVHKCVLAARSLYFNSMLLQGWIETSYNDKPLALPTTSNMLVVMLDYIYTGTSKHVKDETDVDNLCSLLIMSDQYLMPDLHHDLQIQLECRCMDVRNATDLLQFAYTYNASHLYDRCVTYIVHHIPQILHSYAGAAQIMSLPHKCVTDINERYRERILGGNKPQRYISKTSLDDLSTDLRDIILGLSVECNSYDSNDTHNSVDTNITPTVTSVTTPTIKDISTCNRKIQRTNKKKVRTRTLSNNAEVAVCNAQTPPSNSKSLSSNTDPPLSSSELPLSNKGPSLSNTDHQLGSSDPLLTNTNSLLRISDPPLSSSGSPVRRSDPPLSTHESSPPAADMRAVGGSLSDERVESPSRQLLSSVNASLTLRQIIELERNATNPSPTVSMKPLVKLSQKQRKLQQQQQTNLLSQPQSQSVGTKDEGATKSHVQHTNINVWGEKAGAGAEGRVAPSFLDVLNSERQRKCDEEQKQVTRSAVPPAAGDVTVTHSPGCSKVSSAPSPAARAAAGAVSSLSDIMRDEEVRSQNLHRQRSKPLSHIQIEERAMEELMQRVYGSEEVRRREYVEVRKVTPHITDTAAPQWRTS